MVVGGSVGTVVGGSVGTVVGGSVGTVAEGSVGTVAGGSVGTVVGGCVADSDSFVFPSADSGRALSSTEAGVFRDACSTWLQPATVSSITARSRKANNLFIPGSLQSFLNVCTLDWVRRIRLHLIYCGFEYLSRKWGWVRRKRRKSCSEWKDRRGFHSEGCGSCHRLMWNEDGGCGFFDFAAHRSE